MLSRRAAEVPAPGQGKCGSEQGEPRGSGCAGSVLLISTSTDFLGSHRKVQKQNPGLLYTFSHHGLKPGTSPAKPFWGLWMTLPAGLLELRCGKGERTWREILITVLILSCRKKKHAKQVQGRQGRPFLFHLSILGTRKNEPILKHQNFYLKRMLISRSCFS